jgi:histidine triad (HIT) family protein
MPTVFTKIINGELPAYKVHEDELTLSFLALDQVNPGHVLVIPKQEVNHWFDVPPEIFNRVGHNAQMIAKAIKKVTGCQRVGVMVVGIEVPHYHMHLVPISSIAELDFKRAQKLAPDQMEAMQKKIIEALN